MKKVGEFLKEKRDAKGMSLREAAEKAEREARTKKQQPSGQQAKTEQPKAKPASAAPTRPGQRLQAR